MTRQRSLVLSLVNEARDHPTAHEIFLRAREQMPSISLGTVYRNLGLLADAGEIRRIIIAGQPERFDRTDDLHEHLICARCGRIIDRKFPTLSDYLAREVGVEILSYDLQVHCICFDCARRQQGDNNND